LNGNPLPEYFAGQVKMKTAGKQFRFIDRLIYGKIQESELREDG
jgi:hypothetical protein